MPKKKDDSKHTTVDVEPDALAGLPITGDVEKDAKNECDAMLEGFAKAGEKTHAKDGYFKGKEKLENERYKLATDTEFWACLVFKSRDQKEAFLKAAGLYELGDKYLDGVKVAEKLGVAISDHGLNLSGEKQDRSLIQNGEPIHESEPMKQKGGD